MRDSRDEFIQSRRRRGRLSAQGVYECLAVELEPSLGEPFVLDGLQCVTRHATDYGFVHDLD